jgi:hypothetical protein
MAKRRKAKKKANKILDKELGKLGEKAGRVGGAVGGIAGRSAVGAVGGSLGGAVGGRKGATLAASLLPTESKKEKLVVNKTTKEVSAIIQGFFKTRGTIKKVKTEKKVKIIEGVIGSGFLNMNPSFITIVLHPISLHKTEVHIGASAKEGLIKQNTAVKAIEEVKGYLHDKK